MKTSELDYDLPEELIAQTPAQVRSQSRLLILKTPGGEIIDSRFSEIGKCLQCEDCLVLNDTKVLPARFFASRRTGAKLEGLFISQDPDNNWQVMLKGLRKIKEGEDIILKDIAGSDYCRAKVKQKTTSGKVLLEIDSWLDCEKILEKIGFSPLPPYIKRDASPAQAREDKQRYQTVYAQKAGAVAAPTAGLHFTDELIEQLKKKGIKFAYVTLHVSWGTFKPIAAENLQQHKIHTERLSIDAQNAEIINTTKQKGGRTIAVGTTSTRVLETVVKNSKIHAASGVTDLFITPGFEFKIVDGLVTNFHLPRSSLLALVGAFAGLPQVLAAYKHAIDKKYRFYSYGDAMLIL